MWPLVLFGVVTMNRIYGFDRPLPEQYLRYIGNVLRGDLGVSIDNPTKPVRQILVSRLPATMELTAAALVFALGIGIPLGIVSALHRNKIADHVARMLSLGGVAMPSFWFGLILLIVFFYYLGLFPSSGRLGFIQSPPPHVTGFYTIDSLLSGSIRRVQGGAVAHGPAGIHLVDRIDRHAGAADAVGHAGNPVQGLTSGWPRR